MMLAPVTMYVLSPMDGGHASNHVLFLELFAAERLKETLGREGKETFLYNACMDAFIMVSAAFQSSHRLEN